MQGVEVVWDSFVRFFILVFRRKLEPPTEEIENALHMAIGKNGQDHLAMSLDPALMNEVLDNGRPLCVLQLGKWRLIFRKKPSEVYPPGVPPFREVNDPRQYDRLDKI